MDDQYLRNFTRRVIKPKDCVINALELIGLINAQYADLFRILVGDTGITIPQIEDVFQFFQPNYRYVFKKYEQTVQDVQVVYDILHSVPPGCVIFAGIIFRGGSIDSGHVIILGRFENGNYVVIDPQQQHIFQDLNAYLSAAESVYLLHNKLSP
jgi:hypothetical protein